MIIQSITGPSTIPIQGGNGVSISDYSVSIDRDLIEYIDLLYQLLGVDMTYDEFKNLSTSEKQSFIRDIKIKLLLQNDIPKNK
jgi:hypothetical protein